MALNGKILKYSGSQAPVGYVKFYGDATRGKNLEPFFGKNIFEPLYG
jgi:hypothetical protein